MLQFIFGRPSSGKTFTVLEQIKTLTQKGENSVLIVPEQFTFENEKAIIETIGDEASLYVNVTSFTRLYDEIGRNIGGIASTFLSDSDKIVFMKKTLNSVADELKLWGKYKSSINFAKTLLDTIGEFKINAVTPDDLRKTAENLSSHTLKLKLLDLALIYENYNLNLGEKFIDPADTLTRVYESLKNYPYFKDKTVFLDSFKGFTGQQYKIIERIIASAKDVYISLTNDPEIKGEYCVYANIRKAISSIESIAKSRNINIADPIVLTESRYKNEALSSVERVLAGAKTNIQNTENVSIVKSSTVYDEALFVASEIRRLVRSENYRYRDFVIIARDAEKYRSVVQTACKKNNVNCFYDSKIPLSAFPLAVAVENAFEAINLSTEGLLNFHKTGLGTLNPEQISKLENYTFIWGIKGKMWEKEWDMDPRGLTADDDKNGKSVLDLEEINQLRLSALVPIIEFKNNLGGNAKSYTKAIMKLFENCDIAAKLNKICNKYKGMENTFYSDAIKSAFDEYIKILDSQVLCFGDSSITKKEFCDALNLAVSLTSVGVIPQTLDEVIFGSADRIRPSRPKIAFVLGANQGEFPKTIGNSGLFVLPERKKLIEQGINISDNSLDASMDENYLVYSNVCCASEKLYITYSENSLTGEKREPATFVSKLSEEMNIEVRAAHENTVPETLSTAFSDYCRSLKNDPQRAVSIKSVLESTEIGKKIAVVGKGKVKKEDTLSKETARKLYGKDIYMSATRLDTFNRCHFSYFCRYGLKAENLKSADFNVLQRGTIVHYCLEKIISEYKKGIADLEYSFLDELCECYVNEYLSLVGGFESIKDSKTDFLISRISRSLKEVVRNISDEMKQCDFTPTHCELKIGKDGEIPYVKFPFDSGEILLNGSIDRVDEYNGYVRIIDYKTGSKSFKLPDILFGLNMQMLLYLYAVVKDKNLKAAGILYKPSKRDINGKGLAMNGLVPADERIIRAMEKEGKGEFVPKLTIKKDGTVSKASESFIDAEDFDLIFKHLEKIMKDTGNLISKGDISVSPLNGRENDACKYCEYASVCGIEDSEIKCVESLKNSAVIDAIKENLNVD